MLLVEYFALVSVVIYFFFFSSRRRHTRSDRDWSSDVCSSDLPDMAALNGSGTNATPFALSLSSSMQPDPKVNFTLTINYTGGHQAAQSWDLRDRKSVV